MGTVSMYVCHRLVGVLVGGGLFANYVNKRD